jgi:hypothetical protein
VPLVVVLAEVAEPAALVPNELPGSRTTAHAGRFYGSNTLAAVTLYVDLYRYRELFLNLFRGSCGSSTAARSWASRGRS